MNIHVHVGNNQNPSNNGDIEVKYCNFKTVISFTLCLTYRTHDGHDQLFHDLIWLHNVLYN